MKLNKLVLKEMRKVAIKYAKRAYSPYSTVSVGASVLTSKEIFGGCNVENISYGGTICAERVAILKAVSEKYKKIDALYLYTDHLWSPCGMCLQVMQEFMKPSSIVVLGSKDQEQIHTLEDLLPKRTSVEGYQKNKKNQ